MIALKMNTHLHLHLYISVIVGMLVTFYCIQILARLAVKIGLIDHPGGRKKHPQPVPNVGGIAMFIGFAFACLTLHVSLYPYRSLFASGALLTLVGAVDDMRELSPKMRIIAQFFAACFMIFWGNVVLQQFGNFFTLSDIHLGYWGVLLSIFAVVGLINAVNMLDGADGLAGGLTFIQLLLLCYVAYHARRYDDAKVIFLIASVVLTFLWFNFPRKNTSAKIFMGDAGSMWLGFVLTWFCISLSQPPHVSANPATFVWIMAVPIFDLINVFILPLHIKQTTF